MSIQVVATFALAIALQVVGIAVLPLTRGFADLSTSLLLVGVTVATQWLYSRCVAQGLQISLLIPWATVIIPISTLVIGILLYKEAASPLKIGLLASSACAIAFASTLK